MGQNEPFQTVKELSDRRSNKILNYSHMENNKYNYLHCHYLLFLQKGVYLLALMISVGKCWTFTIKMHREL